MNKENKLVPEFRFPIFKNEGEWEEKVVSQLAEYENGKAHEQDINVDGKYVVVNSKFISTDGEVRKYTNSANCIAQKDDILMVLSDVPNGRAIAKCFVVDRDNFYTVNQRICKLTPTNADSKILYYLLNRNAYFLNFDDGVKQTNLRNEDVLNCPLVLPKNPKEQEKIASCLSSLDETIKAHSQKLDVLKDHKKGLMQNLFPQEGEKMPKYRFKEFENAGDWVEKKLKDLGEFLGGGTPSRSNSEYWSGNIPWISSSDINENDIHNISITQYINESAIIESATKIIPKGSILFVSRVGVGKLAINNEELCTSQDFTSFIPKEVLNLFIAYFFSANKNSLQTLSQGTSIKGFSKSDLEDSKIIFPKNPQEQQKIASCLSSLDSIIKAQAAKIEQLKLHKKGLMQGMFPKIND